MSRAENILASLIVQNLLGVFDEQGAIELAEWAAGQAANRNLMQQLTNQTFLQMEIGKWTALDPGYAYGQWIKSIGRRRTSRVIGFISWVMAASILILVYINFFHSSTEQKAPKKTEHAGPGNLPVMPGRNTATLTLSNGKSILLDSARNGEIAMQKAVRVVKSEQGHITFQETGTTSAGEPGYNTLATPRSGQYQLTLTDGSKVWLNNVSSLRFPAAFNSSERRVELTGEGYFEVTRDAVRPFLVKAGASEIKVLGTSFNIMAYADERYTQMTLLSGLIDINTGRKKIRLVPGQQLRMDSVGNVSILSTAAAQDIISWKDGFFYFDGASFSTVMRQVARWYDVEVEYEGRIPQVEFTGKFQRSLPLEELLKFLEMNQVHFRLTGRKLMILP